MKGFLLLLVLSAAGLAGVLYWRRSLQAPSAPVVAAAGEPAKEGKERRRRRRGARRLARNDVFVASAPSGEAPMGEGHVPGLRPAAAARRPRPARAGRLLDDRGAALGGVRRALAVTGAGAERRAASAHRRARTRQAARRRPQDRMAGRGSVAARDRAPRLLERRRRARAVAGRDRRALPREGGRRARLRRARGPTSTPSSRAASP